MAFGRPQTPFRSVKAYQRALDTMGKLAAQQAGSPLSDKTADPDTLADPESPYVRVVADDAVPPVTPRPPSLRSRSRRARQAIPLTEVPSPGPNTRIVRSDEPASAPAATPERRPPQLAVPPAMAAEAHRSDRADSPVEAVPGVVGNGSAPPTGQVGPKMLHFDAINDFSPSLGPRSWADVAPSQPDRGARSRPARSRPGRRALTYRTSGPGALRLRGAALAAVAVLLVAGVVGFALSAGPGSHGRRPPAASAAATPGHGTPVGSTQTTPPTTTPTTTAAPSAVLVSTAAGTSTYRVGASATITLVANNGPCWVEIRQLGPDGALMFMGDILAGQSRAMTAPVWVRLGNPGAINVNGTSISPPGMTAGQPYNLQFA